MCGNPRVVDGKTIGELFVVEDGIQAEGGRGKGKEIDQVPLCGHCKNNIHAQGQSLSEDHLIPLALERVDRFDGGLSRRRWEAHRDRHISVSSHPLPSLPQDTEDPDAICRAPSPIYIDMHDPLGGSTFVRSPTKPIPKWMQYLSSARKAPTEPRPSSVLDIYFSRQDGTVMSTDDTVPPPVPPHKTPVGTHPHEPLHITHNIANVPDYMPVQMSRPFTLITEEPVQRPSGAKGHGVAGGKHVRFDGATACAIPSASAEYLERYRIGKSLDATSTVSFETPTCLEDKSQPLGGSQRHKHDRESIVSGTSKENSLSSMARTLENRAPSSFDGAYGTDKYSASVGSYTSREEGWAGKRGRPLGLTFQDQLKRVFGFN